MKRSLLTVNSSITPVHTTNKGLIEDENQDKGKKKVTKECSGRTVLEIHVNMVAIGDKLNLLELQRYD